MEDPLWQKIAHLGHQRERVSLIATLRRAAGDDDGGSAADAAHPALKLANRLAMCCMYPHVYRDKATGLLTTVMGQCNSRVCPRCGRIRALQLQERIVEHVGKLDSPRLLTLTLSSNDEPIRDQLLRLGDCFRRLRRTDGWKSHVSGGVAVIECTYNRKTDRWHPHLHVVIDGTFWRQESISKAWEGVTGNSRIVDIRLVKSKREVAAYVAKYVSKTSSAPDAPDRRVVEWVTALSGLRLAQTFGTLHGCKMTAEKPTRPDGVEFVAHVAPIAKAASEGSRRAARLMWCLRKLRWTDDAAVHRRTERRLRDWCHGQEHRTRLPSPPPVVNPPPWLPWQKNPAA